MTKITKSLFGIFVIGVIISFYQLIGDANNFAGFYNSLFITADIVFILSLSYLFIVYKKSKNQLGLWLLILVCFPFVVLTVYGLIKSTDFDSIETTTPEEFQNHFVVSKIDYSEDTAMIVQLVDSLIRIEVVYDTSDFALRYFDGETSKDSIYGIKAIDLHTKIKYDTIKVDTLFYNPRNIEQFAGIFMIREFTQNLQNGEMMEVVEYNGYAFVYNKKDKKPIDILLTRIGGLDSFENCSYYTRTEYLKRLGMEDEKYNLNDVRFWEE